MIAIKVTFAFLCLILTVSSNKERQVSSVKLYCYDKPNCKGKWIALENSNLKVPVLGAYPFHFDNRIRSCRFNGMFILYQDVNFNINELDNGGYYTAYGDNECFGFKKIKSVSSIRVAGHPIYGWRADSITLYQGERYSGLESFIDDDTSNLAFDNMARSMIITGCSPWTVYEHKYFQGISACFYPADMKECKPSRFKKSSMMKGWKNKISSVRKGCYA